MNYSIQFLTDNSDIIDGMNHFIEEWNGHSDFMIVHTSGSTGKPKEIQLKKRCMQNSAIASGLFFDFQPTQRIRIGLSPSTIGGKMLLLRGMLHNMNIEVIAPSKNPLEKVTHLIDFISMVPYQLEYVIAHCPENLSKVKTILLGGAPVSESLRKAIQTIPSEVYLGFGMTETMSHVALMNLKKSNIYQALNGVSFSVSEENQLIIHSDMLGIPSMKTNDVVELISETSFVWKGRSDFAINSAGVKLHPEIIEKKLADIIPQRFFIIGEKNEQFGEIVTLIIEGKFIENIHFENYLSKYEIPKKIYFIDAFVETESGKINRIKTRAKIDESSDK